MRFIAFILKQPLSSLLVVQLERIHGQDVDCDVDEETVVDY